MHSPEPIFEIVTATPADAIRVVDLFESYRDFYQQPPDRAAALLFLEQRLQEGSSTLFLANSYSLKNTEKIDIVGFAHLYPTFSSLSLKRLWILSDLFVQPEFRRHGLGKLLLERSRMLAEETQAEGLTLQTAQDNYRAQSLYEALGWQQEEVFLTYNLLL
jgi:GNAT superfamily N-acetyltransferase